MISWLCMYRPRPKLPDIRLHPQLKQALPHTMTSTHMLSRIMSTDWVPIVLSFNCSIDIDKVSDSVLHFGACATEERRSGPHMSRPQEVPSSSRYYGERPRRISLAKLCVCLSVKHAIETFWRTTPKKISPPFLCFFLSIDHVYSCIPHTFFFSNCTRSPLSPWRSRE